MTDTIEAAQLADMICGCANREQHRRDVKLIEDYVADRITAHTKALIEGAGELERELIISAAQRTLGGEQCFASVPLLNQVTATIAAQKAEIERLTEREAQAKLDGVKAGIEAAFLEVDGMGTRRFTRDMIAMLALAGKSIRELDAEAITKGEG